MIRRALIAACFLAVAMIGAAAQSAPVSEYEVKAAFLYNFVRFVEWPRQAFADSSTPVRICVLGGNLLGPALDRIERGKSIAGRSIISTQLRSPTEAFACHVLFVSRSDSETLKQILQRTRGLPVLTVGENDDFIALGGIINFVLDQDRVRFEINLSAAERHHLKLSSKLLAVARVVNVEGGGP